MNVRRKVRLLLVGAVAVGTAACGSGLLLGPDADQGIEGLALRGPLCPVVSAENPCPDEPYQAWVQILDGGGNRVTRVRSATDGTFRVGLEPGRYTVVGESGSPFPRGGDEEVTVPPGAWVDVTLHFDTGIR